LEDQYFPQNQAQQLGLPMMDMPPAPAPMPSIEPATAPQPEAESHAHLNGNGILSGADMCPSCGTISLIRAEGCRKCMTCGYSEC
jgi:hypothetical protein